MEIGTIMKKLIVQIGFAAIALFFCTGCNDTGEKVDDGKNVTGFLNHFIDTLTIDINPAGGGFVSRSPDQTKYPLGTIATLTAAVALGYTFTGWSGASESTDETITITVDGHSKLTANFKQIPIDINNSEEWKNTMDIISGNGENKKYTINVSRDIEVPAVTFGKVTGITVILEGSATVALSDNSNGSMFRIYDGQTVILNDATLRGHEHNGAPLVYVDGGTFDMRGGTISGNTTSGNGGGVYVNSGTFTMSDGRIYGNTTTLFYSGIGIPNTSASGGGVYLNGGTFTMTDGAIWGNTVNSCMMMTTGGGWLCHNKTCGGGVYVGENAIFSKTGGVINGYDGDSENGNVVTNSRGGAISNKGHAVYAVSGNDKNIKRKETSAVLNMNLYYNAGTGESSGAWDY